MTLMSVNVIAADKTLTDPAQEKIARDLMKEIRCLVCQNQSIEDSDADLAKDLRRIVREQISAGKTPTETKAFLVERYGDWVLLKPPVNGGTIFLWASPIIFMLLGLWAILRRSQSAMKAPQHLSAEEQEHLDKLINSNERSER